MFHLVNYTVTLSFLACHPTFFHSANSYSPYQSPFRLQPLLEDPLARKALPPHAPRGPVHTSVLALFIPEDYRRAPEDNRLRADLLGVCSSDPKPYVPEGPSPVHTHSPKTAVPGLGPQQILLPWLQHPTLRWGGFSFKAPFHLALILITWPYPA